MGFDHYIDFESYSFFLSSDEGNTWYSMQDGVAHKSSITANWCFLFHESRISYQISRVSCQKGPTRHAYAWQIGPFWQDTLDICTCVGGGLLWLYHQVWWDSYSPSFCWVMSVALWKSVLPMCQWSHNEIDMGTGEEFITIANSQMYKQYAHLLWGTVDKSDPLPPTHYQIVLKSYTAKCISNHRQYW